MPFVAKIRTFAFFRFYKIVYFSSKFDVKFKLFDILSDITSIWNILGYPDYFLDLKNFRDCRKGISEIIYVQKVMCPALQNFQVQIFIRLGIISESLIFGKTVTTNFFSISVLVSFPKHFILCSFGFAIADHQPSVFKSNMRYFVNGVVVYSI